MNLLTTDVLFTASTVAHSATAAFHPWLKTALPGSAESVRSNILGVTGLPRQVLAAMFCRDGLFGRDSGLTPAQQAAIHAALPELPGLQPPTFVPAQTPALVALADYVSTLVAGRTAVAERNRLQAAGISEDAIDETATVVDNVLAVFQPTPRAAQTAKPAVTGDRFAGMGRWARLGHLLGGALVRWRQYG